MFAACDNKEDETIINHTPNYSLSIPSIKNNDYEVTLSEIDNIIKIHGHNKSRSCQTSVSPIQDADGNTTMYIINYGINDGWQIISASKNATPILAYAENGYFDTSKLSELPLPLKNWIENASNLIKDSYELDQDSIDKVRSIWRQYEISRKVSRIELIDYNSEDILKYISQDEYNRLMQIVSDSIDSWQKQGYRITICDKDYMEEHLDVFDGAIGSMFAPYTDAVYSLTFRIDKSWTEVYTKQLIKTIWEQGKGYNQSFPSYKGLPHIYVGCGNLAMGQLMKYYEHPDYYDWSIMPLDNCSKATSDMLLDIAKYSSDIDNGDASVNIHDARETMKGFGYLTSKIIHYSKGGELPSIAYIRADFDSGGHAWLTGGSASVEIWEECTHYFFRERLKMDTFNASDYKRIVSFAHSTYMVWGSDPNYNGFYSNNAITSPMSSKLENIQYFTVEPLKSKQ